MEERRGEERRFGGDVGEMRAKSDKELVDEGEDSRIGRALTGIVLARCIED